MGDLLTELSGLVTSAANTGGLSDAEKEALQTEADSILQAIDYVVNTTTFNDKKILAETTVLEIGDAVHTIPRLNLQALGVGVPAPDAEAGDPDAPAERRPRALDLINGDLEQIQKTVRAASEHVTRLRAQIGALDKYALGPSADIARVELENTLAAESEIVDADFAAETAELVRSQTLAQASHAVIQIAQSQTTSVLSLIRA